MKRILLTGGSGFIGRNILESDLAKKYEIIAPSHRELDLLDDKSVDLYFAKNTFDCVLHSAVKPCHRNAKNRDALFESNMRIFLNLERNKDSYAKFINFGSGAIYGQFQDITNATEKEIFSVVPQDEHGVCKYAVHKIIENLPNFVDLIIFGIFGKYEDWEIRFISNALCKSIYGLPITLRQNRRFSYIDVNDLMAILELFIENTPKYKAYNIVPNSYVELANIAKMIVKNSTDLKIASDGFGLDYYGDNQRLISEFPNVKFTRIEDSISKLYDFYAKNIATINKELLLFDK